MRPCSVPKRRKSALLFSSVCVLSAGICRSAFADLAVPAYSSDPGAPYTVYLDFGGFSYSGQWDGNTPGVTPAYGDATTAFSPAALANIEQVWSAVSAIYAPFNVDVTTVDPAVAAGKASTDLQRQNYYDTTAMVMHTVIGGAGAWIDSGETIGDSNVGVTPMAFGAGTGVHTNWAFSDDIQSSLGNLARTIAHENGHGFGLQHQLIPSGTSASGTLTTIMAASVMAKHKSTRSLFAVGPGTAGGNQNDDQVIVNDAGMGGFYSDGVGHTLLSAMPIPMIGNAIDFNNSKGVIVPASSSKPVAAGSSSYQPDYWSFNTPGGAVSLTANSGEEFITPGVADPGATLEAKLSIYNASGTVLDTSPLTSLSETLTTTLPAGTYYAEVTAGGDAAQSGTTFFDQGPYFLSGTFPAAATALMWGASGGSTWNSAGNWNPGQIPQFAGTTISFTNSITASSTVTLDANWTVGNILFDNAANSYTLASGAGGSLTLDNGSTRAGLTVMSGSHVISAPIALDTSVTVAVTNAGDALKISGPISGGGGVRKIGAGTLTLNGSNSYTGTTAVIGGLLIVAGAPALPGGGGVSIGTVASVGMIQLSTGGAAMTLSSLLINNGSTLDVENNKLVVNYGSANDPVTAIASDLADGYAGGSWTGTGIASSAAAVNAGKFAVGYLDGNRVPDAAGGTVVPNQLIIRYTLSGDAYLEGRVGFDDLVVVAQNFGRTGEDWADGNFNYDPAGSVGFADLVSVAQNFGSSSGVSEGSAGGGLSPAWESASSSVPEPAAAMVAIAAAGLLARRRGHSPAGLAPRKKPSRTGSLSGT